MARKEGRGKKDRKRAIGRRKSARPARALLLLSLLLLLLVISIFVSAMIGTMGPLLAKGVPPGAKPIPPQAVFDILIGRGGNWPASYYDIIVDLRLTRICLAALVGCGLAVAGTLMQGLFRNPMADPFVIGISAGGALGASMLFLFGLTSLSVGLLGMVLTWKTLLPVFAFLGALGTVFLVYSIARVGGKVHGDTLLLSGVAVSAFCTAVVMFVLMRVGNQSRGLLFWMMGGLNSATWEEVYIAAVVIIVTSVLSLLLAKDMNVLLMGDETAMHLGMRVERTKVLVLLAASLLAGTAVAFTGIIGFVGLIIPHMMRLIVGPDHRVLLPASALFGATFLIWADTVARTVMSPTELPVGIVTALCGAPFFLFLLRSRSHSRKGVGWGG